MGVVSKIRLKYGRFRKRKFFSYLLTILVILSLATGILALTGIFGSRSELCSVKVSRNSNSIQTLQGVGINLDYIPLNNYVKNSSFEATSVFDTFVLADSRDDYIFMTSDEMNKLSLSNKDLIGSSAKIYTIDERGVMCLIVESKIIDYDEASLGSFEEIKDTNWYWTQDSFVDMTSFENVLSGVTSKGKLVSDASSESFSKQFEVEDDKFIAIDSSDSVVVAVTRKGVFYYSNDGKNFTLKTQIDTESELYKKLDSKEVEIKEVCVFKDKALVLLSDGRLLLCSNSDVYEVEWFESEVSHITSSDEKIVVTLTNKNVYSSSNALVFNEENDIETIIGDADIKSLSSSGNINAVLLNDGRIIRISDEVNELPVKVDVASICMLGDNSILGSSEDGNLYVLGEAGSTKLATGNEDDFTAVFPGEGGRILLVSGGKLYETYVYVGVRLSQNLPTESIYSGDICYIERALNACAGSIFNSSEDEAKGSDWYLSSNVTSWDIYGNGTSVTTIDEAPVGYGTRCARILGTTDGYHVLSQKIADCGSDIFIENAFLRLELQLMQRDLDNSNVKIWLSSEGCENVGFVVDDCTKHFSRYSNVFIASDELLNSTNEIRLNIAFEGVGELDVDGIYLGLDKYSKPEIPQEFLGAVTTSNPSVIRLNNLGIGAYGISYDSLFSSSANSNSTYINDEVGLVSNCNSLEESLRLVKDSKAFPWLVIGSSANQGSVDALLDYLCGSVNSDFGKRRIDNGTAVPWSRQFSNVVIEINDADGIFLSDVQRSAYVNYVIGLVRQSGYYKDFKDKITFVDGMKYDGGVMLSFADCHCSSYIDDGVFDSGVTYIDSTNSMYREINILTPRVNNIGVDSGEYIASLDILGSFGESKISLADCVATVLADDSAFARMILVNINVDYNEVDYSKLIDSNTSTMLKTFKLLDFINNSQRMYCEVQKPLSDEAPVSIKEFNSNVGVYLFKNDKTYYLIVANTSEQQAQFLVDGTDVSLIGSKTKRYAANGDELQSETVTNRNNRYTLQAGQVIVFEFFVDKE